LDKRSAWPVGWAFFVPFYDNFSKIGGLETVYLLILIAKKEKLLVYEEN